MLQFTNAHNTRGKLLCVYVIRPAECEVLSHYTQWQ